MIAQILTFHEALENDENDLSQIIVAFIDFIVIMFIFIDFFNQAY